MLTTQTSPMTFDAERAIRAELAPGERLLWSGRPPHGFRLRRADVFLIPFSLMWAGFALFWQLSVLRTGSPFFILWGVPFVAIGLYLVAGRFFVDAWQRAETAYGVTDRRAVIVSRTPFAGRAVKSLSLTTLGEVNLEERPDGSGTITFGSETGSWYPSWMARAGWPGMSRNAPPAFEMIPNAREVYDHLRNAQYPESPRW